MGVQDLRIELDNPSKTYYAGQTVNGKVTFVTGTAQKFKGILIKFTGEAKTAWSDSERIYNENTKKYETVTTHFGGHEQYFHIQYYLLGGKKTADIVLQPGMYSYPFTCALPPTLPSSLEGSLGFVRYTGRVTLDQPWQLDRHITLDFNVISPLDLNMNPSVRTPFKLELEKKFCFFCCASGPLSLIVHIPVTGFVPGQTVPVTIECDNASNVKVKKITVSLRKLVWFHSQRPHRESKRKEEDISTGSLGPIEAGNSETWQEKIQIPSLLPLNLVNCGIIDVDYEIKVVAKVSGMHMNLDGAIPIVLGTVPLVSFQPPSTQTEIPPLVQSAITATENDPSMQPAIPSSLPYPAAGPSRALGWDVGDVAVSPEKPPPTYEEASFRAKTIFGKSDSTYKRLVEDEEDAPGYPTHAFNPTAPPAPDY
ncbi:AGAP001894-PA-like protein [Anopheles sinensis]|uniref:AGAP001894-PA-like protein n=1 Tax=Anopheles sinensis TaxID=74873 RepID=A0A084VRX4_ANOSI|nr:AGAP001894-PA-like protein [Anopheles sinensis]